MSAYEFSCYIRCTFIHIRTNRKLETIFRITHVSRGASAPTKLVFSLHTGRVTPPRSSRSSCNTEAGVDKPLQQRLINKSGDEIGSVLLLQVRVSILLFANIGE